MENDYIQYALIDLHLHLDGSLSPEIVIEIAKEEDIELPTFKPSELRKYLEVPKNCSSLNEYLERFSLSNLVLQTQNGLFKANYDLLKRLAKDGLLYAEIRMAPQLSTAKGLSQQEVIDALRDSCHKAFVDFGITSRIICCLMRGKDNKNSNIETIYIASKNKDIVCAIDLAGAEALFPNELFLEEFELANKLGLNITIHSGEASGADSVKTCLAFKPKRIGHGIHCVESNEVVSELAKQSIYLEICPTSNVDTKAIKSIEDLPLRKLMDANVKFTINTDDMTVSNTTLKEEYALLEKLGITKKEAYQIMINSLEAAFIDNETKTRLLTKIRAKLD